MRFHYLSDLHLEAESFDMPLPKGDALIVAGDLCHARCLDPGRTDIYSIEQRSRVMRFIDAARASFTTIILIAGNHEHYDGVFEETAGLLVRYLPDVIVLDNEAVEIGGIRLFGATLWSDFVNGDAAVMNAVRRRMGEFFFVKTRNADARDATSLVKFQPEHALKAHRAAWSALRRALNASAKLTIVITHHAPSRLGLNPKFKGNDLDAAYASALDAEIAAFETVPVWIHGHTHVARSYRIGRTTLRSNARGFASKGQGAAGFSSRAFFDFAG